MNRIDLAFPKRAYVRIAFSAVPLGLALFGFYWAWAQQAAEAEGDAWFRPEQHVVGIAVSVIAAIVAAVAVFSLRDRGAHVTWDEHGITEWQGAGPRVAIPWGDARLSKIVFNVRSRSGTYGDGGIDQWTDGHGRSITIVSTTRGVPAWLLRRRCEGETGSIRPPSPPRAGEGVVPDGRATRALSWFTWPMRLGYLPLFGLVQVIVDRPSQAIGSVAPALALISAPLMLRTIRPVAELLRLWRQGARMGGARRVELIANEGTVVHAREADGSVVLFDTAPLHHDDGLLHVRRGALWVVAPRASAAEPTPYRTGGATPIPIEVERAEHEGIRQARGALMMAVGVEIAARTALALIPAIACFAIERALAEAY